jgi:hypothetical protein
MGRRRGGTNKPKQEFAFPSPEQPPVTDAELDAEIDGTAPEAAKYEPTGFADRSAQRRKEYKEKKDIAQAVKEIPQIFTPEQVVWVFDAYVGAVSFIFALVLKADFKIIWEELKLDDDVKKVWAKPLAKIASKYAPSAWAGMTAEIELVASMGIWTVTGFGRAKKVVEDKRQTITLEPSMRGVGAN